MSGSLAGSWARQLRAPLPGQLAQALDIPALRLIYLDGDVPDLRALRLQAGLTVRELAMSVNVAAPTYYAWEQGRWTRLPAPRSLEALARALGESVEWSSSIP